MTYMGKARKDANAIYCLYFVCFVFPLKWLSPAKFVGRWHAKDEGVNVN